MIRKFVIVKIKEFYHYYMNVFRSLKYRNFKLFFYGQSISLVGTWMQKTAISWLVYRLTGSAFLLGLVVFVSLIPSLLLSPYAGSYIDRHDRFKVMKTTQVLALLQAGMLAIAVYFQLYNISILILLSLFQGVINAFDVTCRQSLMLDMVDKADDLPNAIALNSTMSNLARIVGPAIAGLVLSLWGEDVCFIGNFISYFPVLFCLYLMRMNTVTAHKPQTKLWTELKAGFNYITSEKELSSLIILIFISSLVVIPYNTLMPILAKDHFHGTAKTFSLFESAIGLGSIISAVYLANLKSYGKLVNIIKAATLLFGVGVTLLAFSKSLYLSILLMVISGIGMMAQTSAINAYIQTHALPNMRGRAISYYIMAYQGIIPVGSLLVGMMAQSMGTQTTIAIEGLLGIVSAGGFVWYWTQLKAGGKLKLSAMIK